MEPTDSSDEGLHMPTSINLYESGLRRSPHLKENSANNGIKRKAHVTFGATLLNTVSLFTLFYNVKDSLPSMPSIQLNQTPPSLHALCIIFMN